MNDGGVRNETIDFDKFFCDVENVNDDLIIVENLYKKVQESIEESKMVHNASEMKLLISKTDSDFTHLLKIVKIIKGKLDALDKSNVEHIKILGYATYQTRTSVFINLGKKLKIIMDNFQEMRIQAKNEYKETIGRRYFTLIGEKANDELISNLVSSGNVEDLFHKVIQDQGREQATNMISEIQEQHNAFSVIEKNLIQLHQIFLDMVMLLEAQGKQLNDIESHVAYESSYARPRTGQIVRSKGLEKKWRKCACITVVLILIFIVFIIIIFFVLPSVLSLD